ncbi:uncharacterized protein [Triticum aestivum]|uniref:uncharacterized protein n=1 Tax=Triticum aestivum TaxID=4565 RepID=UPI001D01C60F|nr:uncharacterized protein LOC123130623 [Triticum aestivum]
MPWEDKASTEAPLPPDIFFTLASLLLGALPPRSIFSLSLIVLSAHPSAYVAVVGHHRGDRLPRASPTCPSAPTSSTASSPSTRSSSDPLDHGDRVLPRTYGHRRAPSAATVLLLLIRRWPFVCHTRRETSSLMRSPLSLLLRIQSTLTTVQAR